MVKYNFGKDELSAGEILSLKREEKRKYVRSLSPKELRAYLQQIKFYKK